MKSRTFCSWFAFGLLALFLVMVVGVRAGDSSAAAKPAIYDESADGSLQIADAITLAHKDGKRILLQFGANWCSWCHKLHTLCQTDPEIAARLKTNFVVVLIDVNKEHNKAVDAKYGHPISHGIPAIVILDADGTQLTIKDSGELEEGDHHSPVKVMAFLKEWSPTHKS